jgi:mannosyl-3-phosphoglycerate synthase
MLLPGLGAIYHSHLCEKETKKVIINELLQQNAIQLGEKPPKPRLIAPINTVNMKKFTNIMAEHLKSCSALEEEK